MKKTSTILLLLACLCCRAQYGDSSTRVDALPGNQIKVTNLLRYVVGYGLRPPGSLAVTDIPTMLQPDSSMVLQLEGDCGWGQVLPQAPGIEGIEFNSCLGTLAVGDRVRWVQGGQTIEVYVPVGLVDDTSQPARVLVLLKDAAGLLTERVVQVPLTVRQGGFFYHKIKL